MFKYPERLDCVSSDAADCENTYASGGRLVSHSLSYVTLSVGNHLACRSYGGIITVLIRQLLNGVLSDSPFQSLIVLRVRLLPTLRSPICTSDNYVRTHLFLKETPSYTETYYDILTV